MKDFDYSQYVKFVKGLGIAEIDFKIWLKSFLLEQAQRVVREAKLRTPVDTGALRNSYQIGGQEIALTYSVDNKGKEHFDLDTKNSEVESIELVDDNFEVVISNPMEYASYVEYGHPQEPGRFVPAIGKRLKNSWVPGHYMLTIAVDDVQRAMPTRFDRQFKQFLAERGFED